MTDPASAECCAVLIETGGKQEFIFDTAERHEAFGASQLVLEAGELWPREALAGLPGAPGTDPDTWRLGAGDPAELVLASAGTFLALAREESDARSVLRQVTGRALRVAPGLDVYGTVVRGHAETVVTDAFRTVAAARTARPDPAATHLVDPFARLCPTTGLPVAGRYAESRHAVPQDRSAAALAKLAAVPRVVARLEARFAALETPPDLRRAEQFLARSPTDGGPSRVAVVHVEGNRLGRVFRRLADRLDTYRDFSRALDTAAAAAFVSAYAGVLGRARETRRASRAVREACHEAAAGADEPPVVPVLPLVLGGDHLTVVADARVAAAFLRAYLASFTAQISDDPALADPLARLTGHPTIGVGAGVADVSSHFPFLRAYQLADELCQEAKAVRTRLPDVPACAWGYHAVLDGTASTLPAIRRRQRTGDRALLTAAPYLEGVPDGVTGTAAAWANGHDVAHLTRCVDALVAIDAEGRKLLPAGQVHGLRDTLASAGLAAAVRELETLIQQRSRWRRLTHDGSAGTLGIDDGVHMVVPLLDAMALADGRAL